jgi:hypothetical protein
MMKPAEVHDNVSRLTMECRLRPQIAMEEMPPVKTRTKLLVTGAAVVAAGLATIAIIVVVSYGDSAPTQSAYADSAGGASMNLPGLPFHLEARAGTFQPSQRLVVGKTSMLPDKGRSRLLTTPIAISTGGQPTHPLIIETRDVFDVDPDLTVGALWDLATGHVEVLSIERLANRRLRARIPHLSGFAILTFPSPIDLTDWLTGPVLEGIGNNIKDFFDAPYSCPTPAFGSTLLDLGPYPVSVNLQLDVKDNQATPGAAELHFCSRHRFVYEYTAHGSGQANGLILPRSTLAIDVALQGSRGDPFVVDAKFTAQAATATMVLVGLELLPSGTGIVKDVIHDGVLDPDVLGLIANATRSCSSAINAALDSTNASLWSGAVSCWNNQSSYMQAVTDIFTKKAIEKGLESADSLVKLEPRLRLLLAAQSLNRILAELINFGLPKDVSFQYRLRCDLQGGSGCPPRPTPSQPSLPRPAFYYNTAIDAGGLFTYPDFPKAIGIDNHDSYTDLRWTEPTPDSARATGVLNEDKCTPDCASGPMVTYPIEILASAPKECTVSVYYPDNSGVSKTVQAYIFTKISVRALNGSPDPSLVGESVISPHC